MKRYLILIWILAWPAFPVFAQDTVVLVAHAGMATYLDKNPQTNFAVSFTGDTIYDAGIRSGKAVMVDSTLIQVLKFKIPKSKSQDKFNAKKEKALLDHFRKEELEHIQAEAFLSPLKNESMFFENSWGKQFQLWSFETPLADRRIADGQGNDPAENNSRVARYNLFLSFVANSHVVMINIPVLEHESKEAKIALLQEQVANSIRIFAAPAAWEVLQEQLVNRKLEQEFNIQDSAEGLKLTIPYWLNVMDGPNYFQGVFPDINNISNALVIVLVDKSKFTSLEEFKAEWLKKQGGGKRLPEGVKSNSSKLSKYSFSVNTAYGRFKGQKVFLETKSSYGIINFTATDDTFDKNITRFEAFLSKFEIEPF